jgi:acetoin utilization deacetylase AcuC-like enzyme
VMGLADEKAAGRVVALLEGGYVPERVGAGTVAVLRALAGLEAPRGPFPAPEGKLDGMSGRASAQEGLRTPLSDQLEGGR